jgi:L-lactate utilization protein LutC
VGRVRAALGRSAGDPCGSPPPVAPGAVVAPGLATDDAASWLARFLDTVVAVGAHVHRAADDAAAIELGAALLRSRGASAVADASELARAVVAAGGREADPASADVGVTRAWRGVAETGTVVLRSEEGRLAGLLPPVHLVLLAAVDLRPGLTEVYADAAAGAGLPAALVQVTGPSRTADIELTLVTGVHGPGEVHVVVIG